MTEKKKGKRRGQRPKDRELYSDFGSRLAETIRERGLTITKFEKLMDGYVSYHSLSDYVTGESMPSPPVLLKIAEVLEISIDWLLRGEQSPYPRDRTELQLYNLLREASDLGVAEQAIEFLGIIIERNRRARDEEQGEALEQLRKALKLNTIGKRLQHIRKVELRLPLELVARELETTPEVLRAVEEDKEPPSAQMLSLMTRHYLNGSKKKQTWILEGVFSIADNTPD